MTKFELTDRQDRLRSHATGGVADRGSLGCCHTLPTEGFLRMPVGLAQHLVSPSGTRLLSPEGPDRGHVDQRYRTARGARGSAQVVAISRRLRAAMLILAVFAVPSLFGEDEASGTRAARGSAAKRFSFGIMAGTSLAPHQTRSTTDPFRPGQFAEIDQGPGHPPLQVQTASTLHVRHVSVAPLAGAVAAMRLGRGFSVQASLSYRLLRTSVTTETRFSEPLVQPRGTPRDESLRGFLEVPVIVTYRFKAAKWRPFVGIGPTFRVLRERWHEPRYGVATAFGFDLFRSHRWVLTPQIRYTRWGNGTEHPWSAPRNRIQSLVAVFF